MSKNEPLHNNLFGKTFQNIENTNDFRILTQKEVQDNNPCRFLSRSWKMELEKKERICCIN